MGINKAMLVNEHRRHLLALAMVILKLAGQPWLPLSLWPQLREEDPHIQKKTHNSFSSGSWSPGAWIRSESMPPPAAVGPKTVREGSRILIATRITMGSFTETSEGMPSAQTSP